MPSNFDDLLSNTVGRDRLHGRIAREYAEWLRPDHFLFMYLDHAQLSLAWDLRFSWPLAISGIYFRPSFHYGKLSGPPETTRDRVKGLSKELVLRAALRNPHLRAVFSLDPFAVPDIARWSRRVEAVALPEALEPVVDEASEAWRSAVDPARRRIVVFGTLDERKGISVLIDGLERLPAHAQAQLTLVLAGPVVGSERGELRARIADFAARSAVEVQFEDRFVPEAAVQHLLASCDLALLTYQRHVGSSGVLVRAASAGVPVLSTDYGLVGENVRRHNLGLAIDATASAEIRIAIERWLDRPESVPFDRASAAAFAGANTAEAFADTIFSRLTGSR